MLYQPVSVAVSPKGERLYVVESGGERLVKAFDREGTFLFSLKPSAANPLERACQPADTVFSYAQTAPHATNGVARDSVATPLAFRFPPDSR